MPLTSPGAFGLHMTASRLLVIDSNGFNGHLVVGAASQPVQLDARSIARLLGLDRHWPRGQREL